MSEEVKYQQWMVAAQSGDKKAYRNLLSEVEKLSQRYLTTRVASASDRNDITQEILVSIHKARHTYEGEKPFLPWMYAIFNYRLKDFFRRFYRQQERETQESEHPVEDVSAVNAEEQLEYHQLSEKLLSCLKPKQRSIVEMLYLQGNSAQEVSEIMDISVANVRTTAHRAMAEMKEKAMGFEKV